MVVPWPELRATLDPLIGPGNAERSPAVEHEALASAEEDEDPVVEENRVGTVMSDRDLQRARPMMVKLCDTVLCAEPDSFVVHLQDFTGGEDSLATPSPDGELELDEAQDMTVALQRAGRVSRIVHGANPFLGRIDPPLAADDRPRPALSLGHPPREGLPDGQPGT